MKLPSIGVVFIPFLAISCGKSKVSEKKTDTLSDYTINKSYEINDRNLARGQNERVSSLVLHYTAIPTLEGSLRVLTQSGAVSSHWLVPESGNIIYKLVDENKRAYHAGISKWKKRTDINDTSVGIEIVSSGFTCRNGQSDCPKELRIWTAYPEAQQILIIDLAKDIKNRYKINPLCVVGHSDIGIGRKSDPGPLFPWKKLAENGVGAWATPNEIENEIQNINNKIQGNISKLVVQSRLYEFGYDIKKPKVSDPSVSAKLKEFGYDLKVPFSNLIALNQLNQYGNEHPLSNDEIFDNSLTDSAIDAFLMHHLPDIYLSNVAPDNKKILATLQALLVKYPDRAKSSCGF
jgi:N-acetylmuramoyl-L-alanine amidase